MANRVLLGRKPGTSAYGLWISKPGGNVLTAPNANMLFALDKLGQVVMSGRLTFGSSLTQTLTVNHGLGFRPAVVFRDGYDGAVGDYLRVIINLNNLSFVKKVGVSFNLYYAIYNMKWFD